jgi:hypothetical protein
MTERKAEKDGKDDINNNRKKGCDKDKKEKKDDKEKKKERMWQKTKKSRRMTKRRKKKGCDKSQKKVEGMTEKIPKKGCDKRQKKSTIEGSQCAAQVCTFFIDYQSLRELRIRSVIIIATAKNMLSVKISSVKAP